MSFGFGFGVERTRSSSGGEILLWDDSSNIAWDDDATDLTWDT